ncbi:sodium-dependent nutrient amino acid transporter 1-like [Condylostylus longicornis]|uniref:sodium-dependent nutrient amino acid transporter 1-like n=1 Tax=Condylostylus longicornis TaxID=2530218 RepID=UPI00244E3453|nr:sodium-dependent nutrient amino acid transporter 1-like [Condylostylus longicornis]XP_055372367.1 sodium-dependent nutrient amino acid transporter 1-like [Condylostylus longicornis]XP_055372368.1 sodium-dependent nutrient amino acid transporter 1-like [Condylostylus longicornis]
MSKFHTNPTFENDNGKPDNLETEVRIIPPETNISAKKVKERATWGKGIEFLLSCIAMSVGLGNIWRFPFTALENGGGAFLIPYLIVLILVGKPFYYLEMVIGQFSSCGPAKVYNFCPVMRGIGIGQVFSVSMISTYYVALMGFCLKYIVDSFSNVLPWSVCNENWGVNCVAADGTFLNGTNSSQTDKAYSSAELYFLREIIHETDNIDGGIGAPFWQTSLAMFIAWVVIYIILVRGIKSSGKFSYFLAISPYIILFILLIRAATLPGAGTGMLYFIQPQWKELLNPKVWYSAVTQVFFSLTVCLGCVVNYSSYNKFDHNIYRDAAIVTVIDTFTSLLAGFTTFGILGHLAYEVGTDDIKSVVQGGAGLAFISYPNAIARFDVAPQIFSVLFFSLLFILGVGSNIGMMSCSMTAITDNFKIKQWQIALIIAVISFSIGLIYMTPGGLWMLNIIDNHGASMNCLILGIMELFVLSWIYGVNNICRDIKFMMNRSTGLFWRISWGFITPIIMTAILVYFFVTFKPLTYSDQFYPDWAYSIGWLITCFAIVQVPLWAIIAIIKQTETTWKERIIKSFRPKTIWGPKHPDSFQQYQKMFSENEKLRNKFQESGYLSFIKKKIFD